MDVSKTGNKSRGTEINNPRLRGMLTDAPCASKVRRRRPKPVVFSSNRTLQTLDVEDTGDAFNRTNNLVEVLDVKHFNRHFDAAPLI